MLPPDVPDGRRTGRAETEGGGVAVMLFLVTWVFTDSSEEGSRRSLDVFANWTPPAGAEFKGFYGYADGGGGCAILEVDSHETLARTTAPFTPWLDFTATPIISIEDSSGIAVEALTFLDSVE
jgi:hypothetical protein